MIFRIYTLFKAFVQLHLFLFRLGIFMELVFQFFSSVLFKPLITFLQGISKDTAALAHTL